MLIGTFCTLLSAAGLGVAFLVARRRRYAAALRIAAVALLPVSLAMIGVVQLLRRLTFDPVAWAGLGVLGAAALMFLAARLADGRGRRAGAGSASGAGAAADGAAAPALPSPKRRRAVSKPGRSGETDDFSEIEAILKKHGI